MVTIVAAVLLVPAIIWIGLGYAGDPNSVKLPAVSTIGPEMKPYVLTALEKEKRLLPVTTRSVPMEFINVGTDSEPIIKRDPKAGMTQAERDKLAQGKTGRTKNNCGHRKKRNRFRQLKISPERRASKD